MKSQIKIWLIVLIHALYLCSFLIGLQVVVEARSNTTIVMQAGAGRAELSWTTVSGLPDRPRMRMGIGPVRLWQLRRQWDLRPVTVAQAFGFWWDYQSTGVPLERGRAIPGARTLTRMWLVPLWPLLAALWVVIIAIMFRHSRAKAARVFAVDC